MPFCPLCKSEYPAGFTCCADCDVDLVAEQPVPPAGNGWAEVFRGTALQADIACAKIESAGIETLTPDEYVATLGWYAPNMSHSIRVLVRAGLAAEAKRILATPPPPDQP